MSTERHVRLFRNGRNQAVRIPREYELPGNEAVMRKDGDRLVIEPVRRASLLQVLASLEPLVEPWPEIEDRPPEEVESRTRMEDRRYPLGIGILSDLLRNPSGHVAGQVRRVGGEAVFTSIVVAGRTRHGRLAPSLAALAGSLLLGYVMFVAFDRMLELAAFSLLALAVAWDARLGRRPAN